MVFGLKDPGAFNLLTFRRNRCKRRLGKILIFMKITSSAFPEGGEIPNVYTMYGENKIPALHLEEVPEAARSLALIVDDPDAPNGTFTHWLLFNVDPETRELDDANIPLGSFQGLNDYGKAAYGGPKPPSGEHRYFFKLYALDVILSGQNGAKRQWLETAMNGHVVAETALMGRYAH